MAYGSNAYGTTAFGAAGQNDAKVASPIAPIQFGTPLAAFWQATPAETVGLVTSFGTANVYPGYVPGFRATSFGTPAGSQRWYAASLGNITKFSAAYTSFAQPLAAVGWNATKLGSPLSARDAPVAVGRSARANGFFVTSLGSPIAARTQIGVPAGFRATTLPTPIARLSATAAGLSQTQFGTPSTGARRVLPNGFDAITFGIPTTRRSYVVAGLARAPRFGTPRASQSNTFIAVGIQLGGRVGHPHAFQRFNYPAAGFSPVAFGQPSAKQTHRVTSIPPVVQFGTPTLLRSTSC